MKETIPIMTNLLVVDDSRFIRNAIKRILAEAGFGVVDVGDGEEALQLAHESKPDLIILDMLLPKMGGELLLRSLKHDPTTANIPVVVVSSLSQSNADKLKDEGALAYIEKSRLDLMAGGESLLRVVKAALRKAKQDFRGPSVGLTGRSYANNSGNRPDANGRAEEDGSTVASSGSGAFA
ncbi:MAG: response regulator [Terriglobales bacterium]